MKKKSITIILILINSALLMAQKIDTKHIKLNIKFNWQDRQVMGIAEINCSPISSTNSIFLDAGLLTIDKITINNQSLKFKYKGDDAKNNVEIFLDKTYQANEILKIAIEYQSNYENKADPNAIWGSFGKGLRFHEKTSTTPNKRKQIWSSGEPDYNKYWFPCNDDIDDIHSTEIIATIEKPLMIISNGNLINITENNDQTRTFHYKTDEPFPNYLVSIVAGEYKDVMLEYNNIPIHNFGYKDEVEAVKATTEQLPDMMQFLEDKTGYKYPYNQYTQVVVQDYPFPGLNGQHIMSILSDNYIDDYGVHQDFKYLWDGVALQSLASQWFGNLVMPKSWEDIWLNNAFTEYFAGLYTEKQHSKTEYLSYILPFEKSNVLADWNDGNCHPIVTNKYTSIAQFNSDSYSKYRGALVLRILQKELGEENWWKAIKLYVQSNAHKQVTTADFQKIIEQVAGTSYQWFFDQWIYKIGLAKFEVIKNYDIYKKQLIIQVIQKESTEIKSEFDQVKYFRGKLEIEIDQNIETINLEAKEINTYVFSLEKAPQFVHFNFEQTWICETEYAKSIDEYLSQLEKSNDVLAKQDALDKLVEIALDTNTSTDLNKNIIRAIQHEINSNHYWRYRVYALASLRKILILPYDQNTISMLVKLINTEKYWLKTSAIFTLGNTKDIQFANVYIDALNDESDRVINAAAIALAKTKSDIAFDALMNLENKASWKNQSRISALNGLEYLGDNRAIEYVMNCIEDNQSPRWYLATPVWDYPYAAVNTLVALGKGELAYPILFKRFEKSLHEPDLNDLFQNIQLIDLLKDERAKEMYQLLKEHFCNDQSMLDIIKNYEDAYLESIKK